MSCVWVISDPHFGHENITKFRNVSSVEENDSIILDNILTLTTKRDTLWILGDSFLTYESLSILEKISSHVAYLHAILGNHCTDKGRWEKIAVHSLRHYKSVHSLYKMKGKAWLSHHPIHPNELWGKINIHGHVHNATIPDERYVNVCVDNTGMKPIKLQDIYVGWRGESK